MTTVVCDVYMSASPMTELPSLFINYQRKYHNQFQIESIHQEPLRFSNLTIQGATA